MHPLRTLPALVAAVLLLGGLSVSSRAQQGLPPTGFEVGEPFPTLAFPTLDGEDRASPADLRGHKLILHVFASW